ncbi:MAG TPA: hypothetical protein VMV46_01290 [Thermoanaerobaculia bacterium]|nr:hypothetical protein [Thermoanaerobaculia bacterium]
MAWIAAAVGGLLILTLIAIVAVVWLRRDGGDAPVVVTEPETSSEEETAPVDLPEETPPLPLPEQLEQALLQISEGNLLEARSTLEQLSDLEEAGELPPEVGLAYYSVLETLQRARAEEIETQLRDALGRYDVARLNRVLGSMNGEEERQLAQRTGGRALLERVRNVLASVAILETALREGQLLEALEGANRLRSEDPELADALALRERAASGIESSIDVLIEAGRLEEAESRLNRLDRLWPSRPGTAERRQTIRAGIQSQERYESLLASIAATGRDGRPHEGLEMIAGVEVPEEYRERLAQLEEALGQQLEQADRQPPQLQLLTPQSEYRRNQPVVLDFEVSDDYGVIAVSVLARRSGAGEYQELALTEIGAGRYRVEISPSFHDNKPIELWAEARDRLGNVKRLAGPDSPIAIRRGRWWR